MKIYSSMSLQILRVITFNYVTYKLKQEQQEEKRKEKYLQNIPNNSYAASLPNPIQRDRNDKRKAPEVEM